MQGRRRRLATPGIAALVLAAMLLHPRLAQAYIDPNTGGWLFQILMPVFTAAMGAWLLLRRWIAERVRRLWWWIALRRRD